ncbi:MAG: bifunctional lytic transglycosylase/C40 family peptidase [Bacilli bacterium]|uniref:bifunctional lytic transglycosylase/C40 family peptidase n=1 Tax=Cetobacterium sp. TaxID=2071632 RepID=UPI002FCACF4D
MSSVHSLIQGHVRGKLNKKLLTIILSSFGLTFILLILLLTIVVGIISSSSSASNEIDYIPSLNIPPEVEKYRSVVQIECNNNGIPELVDIILALITQESYGRLADIMQSSESQGLPPGTITDPNLSIKLGVNYVAGVYKEAKEKATKNVIETTLQGYNFGKGFVNWSIKKNGGWTQENAIEFSRIHSNGNQRENGTYKYGDQLYVQHVKRYLAPNEGGTASNGGNSGSPSGNLVIEKAIKSGSSWIGKSSYGMGWGRNQNDIANGRFDCSSFVHYAFNQAGFSLGNVGSTNTDTLVTKGKRVDVSQAKKGDLVFFDTYKTNGHVGIYLGNGQFLQCSDSKGVNISSLSNPYWKRVFKGLMVRVIE